VANYNSEIRSVFAGSVPYLKLAGIARGGWQMARAALAAARSLRAPGADVDFLRTKIATARFFADHMLTTVPGLGKSVVQGAPGVLAVPAESFLRRRSQPIAALYRRHWDNSLVGAEAGA